MTLLLEVSYQIITHLCSSLSQTAVVKLPA